MSSCGRLCGGIWSSEKAMLKGMEFKLPQQKSITDYFRERLMKKVIKESHPAVLGDGDTVTFTYSQLDSLSTKLGKALRKYLGFWTTNNLDGDLVIGFCLPVSDIIPVVILAILKLGAAFLVIPASYDEKQIVKIVGVTRPMIVITEMTGPSSVRFDCVRHFLTIVGIDEICELAGSSNIDDIVDVVPLETLIKPYKRIASIVYTAGTKDEPQAVRIGHEEILNRCLWQYKAFPYKVGEVAALSSLLEDVDSIAEILAPILAGFPLHFISRYALAKPASIFARIQESKISRITLAPLALLDLLNAYEELSIDERNQRPLSTIKYWIVSGDTLSLELALRFFRLVAPQNETSRQPVILVHLYGSTEVMSDVSYETFECERHVEMKSINGNVSIGRPIGNTMIYIVDEDMRIVEKGVIGEICVAGACVAAGGYVGSMYLEDNEKAGRFCGNPFTKKQVYVPMYKTGDFGKIVMGRDGFAQLFYEGRTEMTPKVRGRRVDLRDIIKVMNDTNLVEECSVFCYHPNKEDQTLVACCKLQSNVQQEELESALKDVIPDEHHVPEIFPVDEFHYLPTGRLDKHKLLKQYQHYRLNTCQEDMDSLDVPIMQKDAAMILFTTVASLCNKSIRWIISKRNLSMWTLGINSLNAMKIFLTIQENGYYMPVDVFLKAGSLTEIVYIMTKSKTKFDIKYSQLALNRLALQYFDTVYLEEKHKENVITLLSECYGTKCELSLCVSGTAEDHRRLLESNWKNVIMNADLSIVALTQDEPQTLVGAAIVLDANSKQKLPADCPRSIKYMYELLTTSESEPKEHIVWKKKGAVSQVILLGTSEYMSPLSNILLISLLLEASLTRAKTIGFNGVMITGSNPLLKDLCQGIFRFNVLKEVPIHQFRTKDKTKPFRLASNHQKLQVFYRTL